MKMVPRSQRSSPRCSAMARSSVRPGPSSSMGGIGTTLIALASRKPSRGIWLAKSGGRYLPIENCIGRTTQYVASTAPVLPLVCAYMIAWPRGAWESPSSKRSCMLVTPLHSRLAYATRGLHYPTWYDTSWQFCQTVSRQNISTEPPAPCPECYAFPSRMGDRIIPRARHRGCAHEGVCIRLASLLDAFSRSQTARFLRADRCGNAKQERLCRCDHSRDEVRPPHLEATSKRA